MVGSVVCKTVVPVLGTEKLDNTPFFEGQPISYAGCQGQANTLPKEGQADWKPEFEWRRLLRLPQATLYRYSRQFLTSLER